MSEPVRTILVRELFRRLKKCTRANGYRSDVGAHGYRWKTSPWEDNEKPGFSLRDPGQRSAPELSNLHDFDIDIEILIAMQDGATGGDDMILAESDVIALLSIDRSFLTIFPAGRILLTLVETQHEQRQEDKLYAGILMKYVLHYRTPAGQPNISA